MGTPAPNPRSRNDASARRDPRARGQMPIGQEVRQPPDADHHDEVDDDGHHHDGGPPTTTATTTATPTTLNATHYGGTASWNTAIASRVGVRSQSATWV